MSHKTLRFLVPGQTAKRRRPFGAKCRFPRIIAVLAAKAMAVNRIVGRITLYVQWGETRAQLA
jgi:hypothetical protein